MSRPRSQQAHEKVLRAALKLFGERGFEATSMDAITQASGVSKATVYNHWTDKEALIMEVMVFIHGLDREPEDVDTGDLSKDLAIVLTRRPPDEFDAARNRLMPAMIAYSAVHPEFGKAWRHRVMEPPRQCLKKILRRAMDRQLLPGSLDLELSMALLLGPLIYGYVLHKGEPPKANIGPEIAKVFWRAYGQRNELAKRSESPEKPNVPKHAAVVIVRRGQSSTRST